MIRIRLCGLRPFGVTVVELALLVVLTPTFTITDWIYVVQHLMVLVIALTRPAPDAQDRSLASSAAVVVAYAYPYAQLVYLRRVPGEPAWPTVGLVLVTLAACLSCASLATLGRGVGVRAALPGLAAEGASRLRLAPPSFSTDLVPLHS